MQKNQDTGVQMKYQAIKELEVFRRVHLQDMHAYWLSLSALRDSDKSFYEVYDVNYVRDKFPSAPNYLSIRLGKANTVRRHYFAYCQENFQRLGRESKVSFSVGIIHEDTISIDGAVYSIPVRILSIPSFKGNWVTCPYCFRASHFEDNTSYWGKHLLNDLRPYVCTHEHCDTPELTYSRKQDWMDHEVVCRRNKKSHMDSECSLCLLGADWTGDVLAHMSRHLEYLSLFALPFNLDEIEDDTFGNTSGQDIISNPDTVASVYYEDP